LRGHLLINSDDLKFLNALKCDFLMFISMKKKALGSKIKNTKGRQKSLTK